MNQTQTKMASQNFVQGPKMDWTEDPELHKHFSEWREDTELLVNTALADIKDKTTKLKFCDTMGRKGGKDIFDHNPR